MDPYANASPYNGGGMGGMNQQAMQMLMWQQMMASMMQHPHPAWSPPMYSGYGYGAYPPYYPPGPPPFPRYRSTDGGSDSQAQHPRFASEDYTPMESETRALLSVQSDAMGRRRGMHRVRTAPTRSVRHLSAENHRRWVIPEYKEKSDRPADSASASARRKAARGAKSRVNQTKGSH